MPEYKVELAYSIPEWADVEITADNEEDAKKEGIFWLEQSNPEAMDIEIIRVKELNGEE